MISSVEHDFHLTYRRLGHGLRKPYSTVFSLRYYGPHSSMQFLFRKLHSTDAAPLFPYTRGLRANSWLRIALVSSWLLRPSFRWVRCPSALQPRFAGGAQGPRTTPP
jgi:hypothetical protein